LVFYFANKKISILAIPKFITGWYNQYYMNILIFVFIFLLGTIIGSFLNVVIFRFNTGKSITKGRSICMTCNRTLRWYELIPVFSYLFQLGKCRRCAERISHQYPIVELLTGLIFLLIAYHFLPILTFTPIIYASLVIFYVFIFSILIVVSVYDLRHKIIPDTLVYLFALVSFLSVFVNHSILGDLFIKPDIYSILAGPLLALPFALIWFVSKGRWMGLGDAKLMLGIGWMLGIYQGLAAIILSFWIGSVVSLTYMYISRKKINMKTEIPFAPFLILSLLIVFLFNINIFSLSMLFRF
jgi:leader peptidase (prepilin peptidase)/N-methyltransferase